METSLPDLQKVLRNRRLTVVLLTTLIVFVASVGVRNERALFLTRGPVAPPTAFIAQPLPSEISYPGRIGRTGRRIIRRAGPPVPTGPVAGVPAGGVPAIPDFALVDGGNPLIGLGPEPDRDRSWRRRHGRWQRRGR